MGQIRSLCVHQGLAGQCSHFAANPEEQIDASLVVVKEEGQREPFLPKAKQKKAGANPSAKQWDTGPDVRSEFPDEADEELVAACYRTIAEGTAAKDAYTYDNLSAELQDVNKKAVALRHHVIGYRGSENYWEVITAVVGVPMFALGFTSWFADLIGNYFFAGNFDKNVDLSCSTIASIVCILIGFLIVGNCFLAWIARRAMSSKHVHNVLEVLKGHPKIMDKLIEEIPKTKASLYRKAAATSVIYAVLAVLLEEPPYSYRLAAAGLFITIFQLLPQYTVAENCVFKALSLCNAEIDIIISMMEKKPAEIVWHKVGKALIEFNDRLEKLWSLSYTGLIIWSLTVGRGLNAVILVFIALEARTTNTYYALTFLAFFAVVQPLFLLWRLAAITSRCSSCRLQGTVRRYNNSDDEVEKRCCGCKCGKRSSQIPSTVASFITVNGMDEKQKIDHFRVMQLLHLGRLGIRWSGVLISKTLVMQLFYRILASYPVVMSVLSKTSGALLHNNTTNATIHED